MPQGLVKSFNDKKGYGFIEMEQGPDVFVHHTGISGQGFKTLSPGQQVEFDLVEDARGKKAVNVVVLS